MLKIYFGRLAAGLAVLGLLFAAQAANAQTATTTFSVTATVNSTCLVSGNTLAFGTYTGTAIDASTTLSVTCSNTQAYTVGLSAGTGTGATVTNRLMTGPSSATLNYALLTGSYTGTNWGNSSGSWVSGTGNGSAQTLTVYGVLAANQYPTPGSYSDTITVTVTY
jgi:spore coat protein U-like protein